MELLITIVAVIIAGALIGISLGRLVVAFMVGVGILNGDDAEPVDDQPALPRSPVVGLAPTPVVVRALSGTRAYAELPHDAATAERHARIRAFQQREAEIRAARRFM